eukprot:14858-Pyramimonas_sp.AAC.1
MAFGPSVTVLGRCCGSLMDVGLVIVVGVVGALWVPWGWGAPLRCLGGIAVASWEFLDASWVPLGCL